MAILKKDKEGKIMDKMENVVRNFKRGIITLDEAETCVKETYMEYFEMLKNNKRLSLKDFTDHHNYLLENLYQSLKDIEKHSLPKDRMGEIITVDTLIGYLNKESQKEVITCLELDSRNSKYIKENESLSKEDIDDIKERTIWEFLVKDNENFERYIKENYSIEYYVLPFN